MKKLLIAILSVAIVMLAIFHLFPQVEETVHQLLGWY